jgi:MFS family permease
VSAISISSLKEQARNFKLLYFDVFLGTFAGIAGAFTGAFAVRLGATNTEIGLMSSIPSLIVIIFSIPFGRILQRAPNKVYWALGGLTIYRIGFTLLAIAPFINSSFMTPGLFFVILSVLISVPLQFWNIGNVGMLISLVPEKHRAAVFTNRNLIGSVVTIVGVFLAGIWLSHMKFPGNYQLLFAVMGSIAILDIFTWLKMSYAPAAPKVEIEPTKKVPLYHQLKALLTIFRERPIFGKFIRNVILLNIGLWTVGPLYVLYTVRLLGASDAWIGLNSTLSTACSLVGWLIGRRMVEIWGDNVTARRLVFFFSLYPILVGLTHNLTLILIYGGIMNILSPGYSLGVNNLFYRILPGENREDAVAIYNTITSIGPFIFPMVGVALATAIGFSPTLIGCGILAFIGSLAWWIWQI